LKYGNPEEAEERVEELIKIFELQKCENSFVGGSIKKGISGGEKKRVCIAVEMITRPSLLILDEPTSGLDSHKAGSVVKALKKLANEGCTIIFTIHQPSHLLYTMLSNLILLDKG
jgi:ABC-type multidrug transport system ATPase subunit